MKVLKSSLFVACALWSSVAFAQHKTLTVAVIDTGISPEAFKSSNFLCKMGHRDFTETSLDDHHGHGTHVSVTIDQWVKGIHPGSDPKEFTQQLLAKKPNYCQVILKYYDKTTVFQTVNTALSLQKAFRYAINIKVDVINFSGGGPEPFKEEQALIKEALDKGIKVVVAAGNDGKELDPFPTLPKEEEGPSCNLKTHRCKPTPTPTPVPTRPNIRGKKPKTMVAKTDYVTYFPAQYDDRLIVVGNLDRLDRARAPSSNYGSSVTYWEIGTNVLSLDNMWQLRYLTGTSQATAVKTGKIIRDALSQQGH